MTLTLKVICGLFIVWGAHTPAAARPLDESKLVDLTYSFDGGTIYWPTSKPFTWEKESWGREGGFWYTAGRFAASEHGGTHIDAPIHFGEGQPTVDKVPLANLVGPAIVIDISEASKKDADYLLSIADITRWESKFGRIPPNSIVLVRTGWGSRWKNRKDYLGADKPFDTENLHFPGVSREAAELLVKDRKVDGVGIDTASLDRGSSKDFAAHQVLNGANVFGLENVANLDTLPPTGATIIALPMKIGGGTGAPVRIIALLP